MFRRINHSIVAIGVAALAVLLVVLWQLGLFNIVERVVSPDGSIRATVYDGPIHSERFSDIDATPAFYVKERGAVNGNSRRDGAVYRGLWYAPDSRTSILEYDTVEHGVWQEWTDYQANCTSNLTVYLQDALCSSPLADHGLPEPVDGHRTVTFQFLQWKEDSTAAQFHYAFTDISGTDRTGTLWYRHQSQTGGLGGKVFDILEDF